MESSVVDLSADISHLLLSSSSSVSFDRTEVMSKRGSGASDRLRIMMRVKRAIVIINTRKEFSIYLPETASRNASLSLNIRFPTLARSRLFLAPGRSAGHNMGSVGWKDPRARLSVGLKLMD